MRTVKIDNLTVKIDNLIDEFESSYQNCLSSKFLQIGNVNYQF